jgi:hypothetical protein
MTSITKTLIYHAVVKSTITYAAETWCLKAKKLTKLNIKEMDFWRCSARTFGRTILEILLKTKRLR